MKQVNRFTGLSVIALFITLTVLFAGPVPVFADLTARANHDHIAIGFLYNGSTVSVAGISDPDADLIVKIIAPDARQELKRKGKVAGFLWMNVGNVEYDDVPPLYFLASTKPVEDLLNREERLRNGIGYAALEQTAVIEPVEDETAKDRWFTQFITYKESSSLYTVNKGGFSLQPEGNGQKYRVVFDWPYQAPPGIYDVTVYAVKDGKVTDTAYSAVTVEQAGGVKYLAALAKEHGAVYGLISIIAALIAGFGVGMIFKKGGGAH